MQFPVLPIQVAAGKDEPTAADWADVLATFPLFAGTPRRRLRALVEGATLAE